MGVAYVRCLALAWALLALTGCCTREVVPTPGPVEYRDRIVVQPIPAELLVEHPIATGPLSACPDVAADRRRELEQCNKHKRALRQE